VGGGALVAPALYVVLQVSYAQAVALSLIYSVFTKILGFFQHLRQGNVSWHVTLIYGVTGIPGAVLGSQLLYTAQGPDQRVFPFLMSGVLVIAASLILLEAGVQAIARWEKPLNPERIGWKGTAAIAGFQLLVGALMGLTSVGSGSLVILSMLYFIRMPTRQIVGTNLTVALIMVIPASLTHLAASGVDLPRLLLLLVGSLFGTVLGSKATLVIPDHLLKFLIAGLLLISAVATVLKAW
jgi:uncharacterized membrane protein YfcA